MCAASFPNFGFGISQPFSLPTLNQSSLLVWDIRCSFLKAWLSQSLGTSFKGDIGSDKFRAFHSPPGTVRSFAITRSLKPVLNSMSNAQSSFLSFSPDTTHRTIKERFSQASVTRKSERMFSGPTSRFPQLFQNRTQVPELKLFHYKKNVL